MSEPTQAESIATLIDLHCGLPRQGPGDPEFTRQLLRRLPSLPARPRIADLGCGSGAGTLLLAKHYGSLVRAVDAVPVFIEELRDKAAAAGLDHLVEAVCADMATLDWSPASIDLLWSEGAAYNLGFENALRVWRPLISTGGVAVVSEMSWFSDTVPDPARRFWESAYPTMGTEQQNIGRATAAGFSVVFTERLPSNAWWEHYYSPLRERMRKPDVADMNQVVIRETKQEMALFERYSDYYGYTFYILQKPYDAIA